MKVLGRSDREGNSIIIRFRGNAAHISMAKALFPLSCRHFFFFLFSSRYIIYYVIITSGVAAAGPEAVLTLTIPMIIPSTYL